MPRPGVLVLLCASFAATAAAAACSLVVDTSGLRGAAEPPGSDGGAIDSATNDADASDAAATDGTIPSDAAFSCDGGTRLTSFDGFTNASNVVVQGSTLTATGSTTADGEEFSALASRDFLPVPPRVFLSYDLSLTASQVVYFEPGCGIYLEDPAGDTMLRQTFATDRSTFLQYLNVGLPDGGTEQRLRSFADLPNGETTRHVELLLTTSGTNVSVDMTLDGVAQSDKMVLTALPNKLRLRCGVPYGVQTSPGSFATTVTIRNLAVSLCP